MDEEITNRESCADPGDLEDPPPNPSRRHQPTAATFQANDRSNCPFCGGEHRPEACTKVTTPSARAAVLRKQGRCYNCLRRETISARNVEPKKDARGAEASIIKLSAEERATSSKLHPQEAKGEATGQGLLQKLLLPEKMPLPPEKEPHPPTTCTWETRLQY